VAQVTLCEGSPLANTATDLKQSGGVERYSGLTGKNEDFPGSVIVTLPFRIASTFTSSLQQTMYKTNEK
jgi:hypothetical protein